MSSSGDRFVRRVERADQAGTRAQILGPDGIVGSAVEHPAGERGRWHTSPLAVEQQRADPGRQLLGIGQAGALVWWTGQEAAIDKGVTAPQMAKWK